jgi:hypothetical protein
MPDDRFDRTVGLTRRRRSNLIGQISYYLMFLIFVALVSYDVAGIVAPSWRAKLPLNSDKFHLYALIGIFVTAGFFMVNSKKLDESPPSGA